MKHCVQFVIVMHILRIILQRFKLKFYELFEIDGGANTFIKNILMIKLYLFRVVCVDDHHSPCNFFSIINIIQICTSDCINIDLVVFK